MFHMFGPDVGRHHNFTQYRESRLGSILEEVLLIDGKEELFVWRRYVRGQAVVTDSVLKADHDTTAGDVQQMHEQSPRRSRVELQGRQAPMNITSDPP